MSQIANLTAFDGAATPVSHTFNPISVIDDKGLVTALYREPLANVPLYGQPIVKLWSFPRTKNGVYRSIAQVEVPVMESVLNQNASGYTAAPKVAHIVTAKVEMLTHERCDITTRRLVRVLACNIASGLTTTQAVTATGPGPELLDQVVSPT